MSCNIKIGQCTRNKVDHLDKTIEKEMTKSLFPFEGFLDLNAHNNHYSGFPHLDESINELTSVCINMIILTEQFSNKAISV